MKRRDILETISYSLSKIIGEIDHRNSDIFLFGVNSVTEFTLNFLYENGIQIKAILDNNCNKQGNCVFGIPIVAPEYIQNKKEAIILIISQHYDEMKKQIIDLNISLADNIHIIYDYKDFNYSVTMEKHYWNNKVFEEKISQLNQGQEIYEELKKKYSGMMIISPTVSIGDNFLWELSFVQYKRIHELKNYFIVVPSLGAFKAVKLYHEENVCIVDRTQMDILIRFIMFIGEDFTNSLLLYPRHNNQRCFDTVMSFKGLGWHSMYKNGIFQLPSNVELTFPDIKKKNFDDNILKSKGILKGKSVILSPYANTVNELPIWFWELLTDKLLLEGYIVFTNTIESQKKIKGTYGISIPLDELGNYLEYAGTFISIRNGLCDIAGKARCNQIVIYRDELTLHMPKVLFNDLHQDGISPYSKSIIWFERDINFNVTQVMNYISNQ